MHFAPYRIERRSAIRAQIEGAAEDKAAAYVGRLTRLIPAEVLGLYLTFRGLAAPGNANAKQAGDDSFNLVWPIVCLALVVLSRIWGSRPPGTSLSRALTTAQWAVVVISAVSFVLWIYATGDSYLGWEIQDRRWIGASVGVWTFVVPWFYKGTTPLPPEE